MLLTVQFELEFSWINVQKKNPNPDLMTTSFYPE